MKAGNSENRANFACARFALNGFDVFRCDRVAVDGDGEWKLLVRPIDVTFLELQRQVPFVWRDFQSQK